ncbi:nucleoside deaminase [Luteolibacter sp. AS25]|uniref:nucleoside deaminase n=1 Tax=Luteolibacter sp. AS25 TaxID=3135776 RepID=UPI00398A6DD8
MKIEFMERAVNLARKGMLAGDGGPFGAVLVRDGLVLGEGWNRVLATNDPTAHGEVVAIRDACAREKTFSLEGCEIYTTGQPCPMCLGAIYWAGIRGIYYGFSIEDAADIGFGDEEFFHEFSIPRAERKIPENELGRDLALKLAAEYSAMPDRQLY